MAGAPDALRFLVERYGSIERAEEQARSLPGFGEEIRKVESQLALFTSGIPLAGDPSGLVSAQRSAELRAHKRDLVLAALIDDVVKLPSTPKQRSHRGRRDKSVSVLEANQAAAIYWEDPAEYDDREDGGAYAVHTLYIDDRDGPALLSRTMVGHLIRAIREGWLPWDAEKRRLGISDEFRTSRGMFVIPRDKPAS